MGASIFGKAGYAARIADFASLYILAFAKVISTDRPDVVVSFTTPPFIGLVGIINRWVRGSKAVYWVMDLYPDLPVACGVMKPASFSAASLNASTASSSSTRTSAWSWAAACRTWSWPRARRRTTFA